MPRCIEEGYAFVDDEKEEWVLKADAPDWAVDEFNEFKKKVNPEPDDSGLITQC